MYLSMNPRNSLVRKVLNTSTLQGRVACKWQLRTAMDWGALWDWRSGEQLEGCCHIWGMKSNICNCQWSQEKWGAGMDARLLRVGPSDNQCGWSILPQGNHQPWREFGRRAQFSEDNLTVILKMLQRCVKCCFYFPVWQYRRWTRIEVSQQYLPFLLVMHANVFLSYSGLFS